MGKKKPPKVLWLCRDDVLEDPDFAGIARKKSDFHCKEVRMSDCESCPGPLKYVLASAR